MRRSPGWLIAYGFLALAVLVGVWLPLHLRLNDERSVRERHDARYATAIAANARQIKGLRVALDQANAERAAAGLPPIVVMPAPTPTPAPTPSPAPTTSPPTTSHPVPSSTRPCVVQAKGVICVGS